MMRSTTTVNVDEIFAIIAEEVGVSTDELTGDVELADLGVDNILSKSILSRITEQLKLNLPASTFQDHDTADSLRSHLEEVLKPSVTSMPKSNSTKTKKTVKILPTDSNNSSTNVLPVPASPLSFLLQEKPTSSKQTIFLLPDGSGSGMAYSMLPPIDPEVCLIALNSPYLAKPEGHRFTVQGIASTWAEEILRRQPHGPYILGGWSAGGYYSFEVTKYLTQRGHKVSKLILIDSPCRLVFEELPMEVVHYLSQNDLMGNWGTKKPPAWMVSHFDISIRAISEYVPTPLDTKDAPEVFVIWARDGVLAGKDIQPEDTGLDFNVKVTEMLVQRPSTEGALGWDGLFPGAKLAVASVPGNHFTIVYPPNCESLSMLLRDGTMDSPSKRDGRWKLV